MKDVEREVAELNAKGVRFEEYDMPGMKTHDVCNDNERSTPHMKERVQS